MKVKMQKKTRVRTARQARRWQQGLERYRRRHRMILKAAPDILSSENFHKTKEYIQHGNVTVNNHVMDVAHYSLIIAEGLHIRCNRKELIRGALLHDYFLYDWHIPDRLNPHNLHGFYHPGKALRNASREYDLTKREKDIIKKHMWPLTIVPPRYKEAWVVTAADKWCSLMETIHLHKGHGVVYQESGKDAIGRPV